MRACRPWITHTAIALAGASVGAAVCWPLCGRLDSSWLLLLFGFVSVLFTGLIGTAFGKIGPQPAAPFAHALDSLGDGVVLADRLGKITYLNPAAESLLGWRRAEAVGKPLENVLQLAEEATGEPLHCEVARAQSDNVIVACNNQAMLRRRDGSKVFVDVTGSPLFVPGQAARGLAVVFRDRSAYKHAQQIIQLAEEERRQILDNQRTAELEQLNKEFRQEVDDRRQAEQQLQHAKEAAEGASSAKSAFLANVSHEIRTPMNGILGMTTLALAEEASPRLRSRLRIIHESADALLLIVNDLLDFSKMEAGKFQIHCEPFDLHTELISTVKVLTDRAKQKGLELNCTIAPDVPADVSGDSGRLRQILINLIGNAVKFTKHGSIGVEVGVLERTDTHVRLGIEVSDTGIGIPAEVMARIFSPFVQGDGSMTRQYGGTGLGLSIARNLVEMMGGTMEVQSTVGKGSTFRFNVLLGRETAATITLPGSVLRRLKSLTALVIDQNMAQRLSTLETLKKWGLRATGAAAIEEALEYMHTARKSKQAFDFVLLDDRVGNEDLAGNVRRLRLGQGNAAPIILLGSAPATEHGGRSVAEAWLATCLAKPYTPSDLLEAIAITLQFSSFEIQLGRNGDSSTRIGLLPKKRLSILLAEDNHFNQVVAMEMLQKVGHQVTVVGNGREAVAAVANHRFDLVLMDVQMPEMDGLEATALIRAREPRGTRLPIVAMTAHAMKGDEEACLKAGMDGYLSKPVNQQLLHREIARVMERQAEASDSERKLTPPAVAPVSTVVVQPEPSRRDRRKERMMELFRVEGPKMMAEIRAALTADDASLLSKAAHKLCGAICYLSAPEAEMAARRVETLGREVRMEHAALAVAHLEECLARIDPVFSSACTQST